MARTSVPISETAVSEQPLYPRFSNPEAPSEEDMELLVAKEMAQAIQENPNLTPAQLKEMITKMQSNRSLPTKSPKLSSKSPILKQLSKGVKSSVKKAFHVTTPERKPSNEATGSPTGASAKVATATNLPSLPSTQPTLPPSTSSRGMRFGDILESSRNVLNMGSSAPPAPPAVEGGEDDLVPTEEKIRITGIVWKRRSGLGKYSTTAAWERRRVVLRGHVLYYYRTGGDSKDDDGEPDPDDAAPSSPTAGDQTKASKSWFMDMGTSTKVMSSKSKEARGYLDLVKENASVGASLGHSGAPTPFAISIKVLTQTKWKLCFDTHAQLMQWLAAMTDCIIQGSVDIYNAQILAANDPSKHSADFTSFIGQLSEPPRMAQSDEDGTVGGHRLWGMGHYKLESENYLDDGLDIVSANDLEEVLSEDEDDNQVSTRARNSGDLVFEMDGGQDIWGIPAQYIWRLVMLWNAALVCCQSSFMSVDVFWYIITLVNVASLGLLKKERVGGKVKPSLSVSRKLARRLSSELGIPVVSSTIGLSDLDKTEGRAAAKAAPAVTKSSFMPHAGSTTMQIENATDLPVNKDGVVFAGWRHSNPSILNIRSHNYKKDKIKVPSPGEMYKCVHVDIFESKTRFPDMASRVKLPTVNFKDEGPKTWNAPDIFVVSIQIPTDPPKMYSNAEDGGGFTVTIYFIMEQETRDILKRVTADGYDPSQEKYEDINKSKANAVRLLDEWCRRAPTDDEFCARFKVLPNAHNLKEIGMPNWISRYNGKPFLIKRPGQTGFLYRHPESSCVEFDISLHPFPYLAKQGICFMKDTFFKKVLITFGFLIEGRAEDELPECLIGLMQLCYPDPIHAMRGEDFLAGKGPKSFE
eukprot:Nitzschia sp. Nitz4//scaffold118_size93875//39252//41846//NITZ4_004786-RA/size93875-processed-gene-0.32-mRNA-1//1//CDS//3329533718//3577//frame0